MPVITEVRSLSAAAGWFIENMNAGSIEDLEAVACFALVSTFDPAYPNLGTEKTILPVSVTKVGENLLGQEVATFGSPMHESVARTVWNWLQAR